MTDILFKIVAGLGLFVLLTLPVRAAERHTLDTRVPAAASNSPLLSRLPATNRLHLAIALPLRNQNLLTNLVQQLYDRRSTNFHQYLTPPQFADQFGPTEQDYQSVINYAKSNHLEVERTFGNRALVDVEGSVADIERMFQVHLGLYQHPTENRQFYGPDVPPSVDAGLPILHVSGLDNYFTPHYYGHATRLDKNQIHTPAGGSSGGGLYQGTDFQHAYAPDTSLNGAGQVVGLFEFDGYTPSDIHDYETNAGLPSVPLDNVLLTYSPGGGNFECASDIELVIAMAPGIRQVNVYEAGDADTILNEMAYPSQGEPMPNQLSSSWGFDGDTTNEAALIEMAVQGQAFFTASGDGGAGVGPDTQSSQYFSSYMTYVGGTQLFMSGAGGAWTNEVVWHDNPGTNFGAFSSKGGVYTDVPIPEYQQNLSMALNHGSTQYRNYPDVAMVARDILICATALPANGPPVPGQFYGWVGTSASSPLWAGFVALVNQQAAAQGKPPVGFLNPALYEVGQSQMYAACFHDITNGNNTWFNTNANIGSPNLYYATNGYDLCTGWGTPTGESLINALIALAGPVIVDFTYAGSKQDGTIRYPYQTLAQGTNAVSPGGTIFIINGGSSSETMTISKPMTITAQNGASTVGNGH